MLTFKNTTKYVCIVILCILLFLANAFELTASPNFILFNEEPDINCAGEKYSQVDHVDNLNDSPDEEFSLFGLTSNNQPVVTTGSNSPVCFNSFVSLNATVQGAFVPPVTWTGASGFTAVGANPTPFPAWALSTPGYHNFVAKVRYVVAPGDTAFVLDTLQVLVLPLPVVTLTADPLCAGGNINIHATVTVTEPQNYSWTGPNNFTLNGSSASNVFIPNAQGNNTGQYSLVVTDVNGCTNGIPPPPLNPASIQINFTEVSTPDMPGSLVFCNLLGSVNLTAYEDPQYSGGAWQVGGNVITGGIWNISALSGNFSLDYIPSQLCVSPVQIIATVESPVNISIPASNYCITDVPVVLNSLEPQSFQGGVWLGSNVSGSNGVYTFSTTSPGSYTVQYLLAGQCADTMQVNITVEPLNVVNSNDTVLCQLTGSFNLNQLLVNPVQGVWNGSGQVVNGLINTTTLSEGIHTFSFMPDGNCFDEVNVQITIEDPYIVQTSTASVCVTEGAFSLDQLLINQQDIGGTWYGDNLTIQNGILQLDGLSGTVNIHYIPSHECAEEIIAILTIDELIVPELSDTILCYGFAGLELSDLLNSSVNGNWQDIPGVISNNQFIATSPGTYSVTFIPTEECISESIALIHISSPITVEIEGNEFICGGDSIVLTATAGFETYTWLHNNGINPIQYVYEPGIYSVIVSDLNGCTSQASFEVVQVDAIEIQADIQPSFSFQATGEINLSVINGELPFSYAWSNGAETPSLNNVGVGTYAVTITDAYGCQSVFSFEVPLIPCDLNVSVQVTAVSCPFGNDGVLEAVPVGGQPPFTYIWNNGANTSIIENLESGTYQVTIVDSELCEIVETIIVVEPEPIEANPQISHVSCYNQLDGSIQTSTSGGSGGYTFLWSNGSTSESIFGLAAGLYALTITDSNNCTAEAGLFEVIQPDSLYVELISQTNVLCNGGSTGSIEVAVNGGNDPISFTWSNGDDSSFIDNLSAGTYNLELTDINGCNAYFSASILQSDPVSIAPVITASLPEINTGSIILNISGGQEPYGASWSSGQDSHDIVSVSAGSYIVTVTDANGCTTEFGPLVVDEIDCEFTVSIVQEPISCPNGNDGVLEAFIDGSIVPPMLFDWNTGDTTAMISNLAEGIYTVTVTDGLGCTFEIFHNLVAPETFAESAIIEHVSCFNGNDGQIAFSVTGGTQPYYFSWSNGDNAQNLSNVISGTYYLTLTDQNDCEAEFGMFAVDQPDSILIVVENLIHVLCYGDATGEIEVSVTGGTGEYTMVGPGSGSMFFYDSLLAGNYDLTVSDSNNCSSSITFAINQPEAVAIIPIINSSLPGESTGSIEVLINGGQPPYDVIWSGGQQSPEIENLPPGPYYVTISDANGCTQEFGPLEVPEIECDLNLTVEAEDITCSGSADGVLSTVLAGIVVEPLTYIWNTGDTTAIITEVSPGTYSVTVTDALGCTYSAFSELISPLPQNAIPEINDVSCQGGTNGAIAIEAGGGTGTLAFSWSNGVESQDNLNIPAGSYTVTLTDANNCEAVFGPFIVNEPDSIIVNIYLISDAGCYSDSTGQIAAEVTGGTGSYTLLWSSGESTVALDNLGAGTYNLTVTDENECVASQSISVNYFEGSVDTVFGVSCDPEITILEELLINQFGCDSVIITVFQYEPPSTDTITLNSCNPLEAGVFVDSLSGIAGCDSIIVTSIIYVGSDTTFLNAETCNPSEAGLNTEIFSNQFGCDSVVVTDIVLLPSQFNQFTEYSCNPLEIGLESFVFTNQYGCDSVVEITTLFTSDGIQNESISIDLCYGGTYDGTIYYSPTVLTEVYLGANGCDSIVTVNVNVNSQLSPEIEGVLQVCSSSGVTTTTLSVNGPFTNYQWSSGGNNSEVVVGAGIHSVTITDNNGCTGTAQVEVSALSPLVVNVIGVNNLCAANAASAQVYVTGGLGGYNYQWSNGATGSLAMGLASGIYDVTITDSFGCTSTGSTTVQSIENPPHVINTVIDVTCFGQSNGSISSVVTGGYPPYNYQWSNGATSSGLSNVPAGIYTLYITDQEGCIGISTEEVDQPAPLLVDFAVTHANTGMNNGSVMANVFGGTPQFTYLWNTGATTQSISNLAPGNYSVSVTDSNGCEVYGATTIQMFTATDMPEFVQKFNIYPNPNNGQFLIELELNEVLETMISLYSVSGQLIRETNQIASSLSVHFDLEIPAGVYLLRVKSERGVIWKKVVVQ